MSRGEHKRMRKDQRGFTIVELLIAIAILAIVVAAVCGFILVGSRSYASANSDISVQQEAQLALNQMSDVLIDTTRSVNYAGYDASGKPVLALKDSEFGFEPVGKSLIMYNGIPVETTPVGGTPTTTIEPGNGNKHYHFYWNKDEETLYYAEIDVLPDDIDAENHVKARFPAFGDPGWVVLAEHVTKFEVDLTQVEEKRVVQLELTFVNGKREYNTSNNVTIRNKVGVNDAEIGPLDRSKSLSLLLKESLVILEPGETYHFSTPKITGQNVTDKSVTWEIVGGSAQTAAGSTFIDRDNGVLKIAVSEEEEKFEVEVKTKAKDSEDEQASKKVEVRIKRVTGVGLNKTYDEDATNDDKHVTIGKKFTVTSSVEGPWLEVLCSGYTEDEDISKDKDVVNWTVEGPAKMTGSSLTDAQFTVESTAKEGDIIIIRATSYRSTKRPYPDVVGELRLTVKKAKSGDMELDGDIYWGKKIGFKGKYPNDFNKGGQGYYLICARIKEDLNAPASQDKIMIYRSHGDNSAMMPDLFGVKDVSKPWYVSLQVLDPGSHFQAGVAPAPNIDLQKEVAAKITDPVVTNMVADYLKNCDSEGTYNGTYPHTDKITGIIYPPEIYYAYDGKENLPGQLKLNPVNVAKGDGWNTNFRVHYVKNTRGQTDGGDWNAKYVKYKVYKEGANGDWGKSLYQYKGNGQWDGSKKIGPVTFDITSATNMVISLDQNDNNLLSAVGNYHLMPVISYSQEPTDSSYEVYYLNYSPNCWNEQTYEVPESAVHYEVRGGNLELWAYANNSFRNGVTYFPTPSSDDFTAYFDRNETSWQNAKKTGWFTLYLTNGGKESFSPSRMRCRYIAKNEKGYELELFYNYWLQGWNMNVEISAGVFHCAENGDIWEQVSSGPYDSYLEKNQTPQIDASTADVKITGFSQSDWNCDGKMYIPLPSEKAFTDNNGFGFALNQTSEQTKWGYSFKYQPKGQSGVNDRWFEKVTCNYDSLTGIYTLELFRNVNGTYTSAAKFKCQSDSTRWTQIN